MTAHQKNIPKPLIVKHAIIIIILAILFFIKSLIANAANDTLKDNCINITISKKTIERQYNSVDKQCNSVLKEKSVYDDLFKKGHKAYGEKEYKNALKWYQKASEKGDGLAAYMQGRMFYNGEGVKQDYNKAYNFYQQAVANGIEHANYNLGIFYLKGRQQKKDLYKARILFEKAFEADPNNTDLLFILADMYGFGEGGSKDTSKKLDFLTRSSEMGHSESQLHIGLEYLKGEIVDKDQDKAFEWIQKSAKQNNMASQYLLANSFIVGDIVDRAPKKAFDWYSKAAKQGHILSQAKLAEIYFHGEGNEADRKNYNKALEWYVKAATSGDAGSAYNVGKMHIKGLGIEKNKEEGIKWLKKSAFLGFKKAPSELAYQYGKKAMEFNTVRPFFDAYTWAKVATLVEPDHHKNVEMLDFYKENILTLMNRSSKSEKFKETLQKVTLFANDFAKEINEKSKLQDKWQTIMVFQGSLNEQL